MDDAALDRTLRALADATRRTLLDRLREKRHFLNPAPLNALPSRWTMGDARRDGDALTALLRAVDDQARAADPAAPVAPATRRRRRAAFRWPSMSGTWPTSSRWAGAAVSNASSTRTRRRCPAPSWPPRWRTT
jgi:hypothetical protein